MQPVSASVCLFCGSRTGSTPAMAAVARETGAMLARENWRLVYGAGDVGLMGETARATQAAGGQTLGVIPQHLMRREMARRDNRSDQDNDPPKAPSTLIVTETMHERKKVMFTNSDAAIVLPGGAGTLDEFFEVLTWAQIGLHTKPVVLLNAGGFWQPLLALIDHIIEQGYAEANLRALYAVAPDVPTLATMLRARLNRG